MPSQHNEDPNVEQQGKMLEMTLKRMMVASGTGLNFPPPFVLLPPPPPEAVGKEWVIHGRFCMQAAVFRAVRKRCKQIYLLSGYESSVGPQKSWQHQPRNFQF
jgi:hypothetical protein